MSFVSPQTTTRTHPVLLLPLVLPILALFQEATAHGETPVAISTQAKTAQRPGFPKPLPFAGYVTMSANGVGIPHPGSTKSYPVTAGESVIQVPEGMVYIPAGDFTMGAGPNATRAYLDGYCIGKFHVTNAEYKVFLDSTHSQSRPLYWTNGIYPEGRANHPVVGVSLAQAQAYADWISRQTGWTIAVPNSQQWEKAARGPDGFLYPWGNTFECTYREGVLRSKCNYNAVTAVKYLKGQPKLEVTYNHPDSNYLGTKTTVDRIAAYGSSGEPSYLDVSMNGAVRGWASHATHTGFVFTDLYSKLAETGGETTPVGTYEDGKSRYGSYDMAGNVSNWCTNLITAANGREVNEIRGGSWHATGNNCRSVGSGEGRVATGTYDFVGFRLVMIPPPTK